MDVFSEQATVKLFYQPSEKDSTLNLENTPREKKYFLIKIDPYSEETWKQEVTKITSLVQNGGKSTKCI